MGWECECACEATVGAAVAWGEGPERGAARRGEEKAADWNENTHEKETYGEEKHTANEVHSGVGSCPKKRRRLILLRIISVVHRARYFVYARMS